MADIRTSNLSHLFAPALLLSLVLLTVHCGNRAASSHKVTADKEQSAELRDLLHQGNGFYRSGEYIRAIQIYESGYAEAKRRGSMQSAVRFLNNLGSAHYEMFRYRDAIHAYLEARDLATVQGNQETLVALCSNLSSLYFQLGDVEAARESAEQGLKLPGAASAKFKAKLLIQYARIRRQQKDSAVAVALLKDAIAASKTAARSCQRGAGVGCPGHHPDGAGPALARGTSPGGRAPAARIDARRSRLSFLPVAGQFAGASGRSAGGRGAFR